MPCCWCRAGVPAMNLDRRMESLRFLIRDRDTKYLPCPDTVFEADGLELAMCAPQATQPIWRRC
jgi:hypothetical protein